LYFSGTKQEGAQKSQVRKCKRNDKYWKNR